MIAVTFNASAASPVVPSDSSCEAYSALESVHACGDTSYLRDAAFLCEKYLAAEPSLSEELREFQRPIRHCLQKKLLEASGANFCSDLAQNAVISHLDCYQEFNYCGLSREAKKELRRIIGKKALEAPWFETGFRLSLECVRAKLAH